MYSLWLVPKGDVRLKIEKAIYHFAEKYNGPKFVPHLTFIGNVGSDEATVRKRCQSWVFSSKKIFVKFENVAFKDTSYFQCVFLRCSRTTDLKTSRQQALEAFYIEDTEDYVPHVSLLYSDMEADKRQKVANEAIHMFYEGEAGMEDRLLSETGFWAEDIELWEVNPNNQMLQDWKHIETFPFEQ